MKIINSYTLIQGRLCFQTKNVINLKKKLLEFKALGISKLGVEADALVFIYYLWCLPIALESGWLSLPFGLGLSVLFWFGFLVLRTKSSMKGHQASTLPLRQPFHCV